MVPRIASTMATMTLNPGGRIRPAPALALLGITAVSVLLAAWNIGREGTANIYYAAAVRSMLADPIAFLFGGFDAGGFITLDKPPLGFQLQAISARILGFNGLALLLPQLVATVASVLLLYAIVRPAWGIRIGLLAALALATTPISVAAGRNNTPDATLVAALLAGAWTLQRGLRTGQVRWLLLAAALVGVAFNIKMLQAWLVVPAMAVAWLAAGRGPARSRGREVLGAAAVLVVVSFAWPLVVAAWPTADRPWIGGSVTNSLFNLAFAYN